MAMGLGRLKSWLRELVFRRSRLDEIDEELQSHLEHEIEALVDAGVDRGEAERRARAGFGSVAAVREECREARGTRLVDTTLQDLRYGARMLVRYPGFSLTAVLTLAFTFGAVATVLTLVDTFYFDRWPVDRPEEILEIQVTRDEGTRVGRATWSEYVHFRDAAESLQSLAAAYTTAPLQITTDEQVFEVNGAVVSASLFPMLGLEPQLGRFFGPGEDAVPGRDRVAVISHDFWRSGFGGNVGAIGATLTVNETVFTIIGVAPASFRGFDSSPVQLYLPMMMIDVGYRWCSVLEDAGCTILQMFGRLAEGASLASASVEIATLAPAHWVDAEPGDNSGARLREVRGKYLSGVDKQFLRLLLYVAGGLLAVCCANLAGLLISRGRERGVELAIRASIGASRGRIVRQLSTEALVLSLAGGGLGLVTSVFLTGLLEARFYALDSSGRPLAYDFSMRPEIIAYTFGVAVLAGLLFGLAPASGLLRRASRLAQTASTSRVSAPAHHWLLGLQVASAVALVAMAALLAASADARSHTDNLNASRIALLRLRPRLLQYPPDQSQRIVREVVERLEATPGVESVSMVGTGIALLGFGARVATDAPDAPDAPASSVGYMEVGPRYFETLGTPVLRGREFTRGDDTGGPRVAVVNAALGHQLWPNRDPLGATIRVDELDHVVVGLVADVELQPRGMSPRPYVFVPFWQNDQQTDARLQVRVSGDPAAMIPTLIREIRKVDPRVPVTETITLGWRLAGMFRPQRMSATAVIYAGTLAALLSALGLYASLAAAVAQRRKEIGIRKAIGATSRGIVRLILGEGLRVILAGIVVGLAGALAASHMLRHLLYGAAGGDMLYIGLAGGVVIVVAVIACLVPAWRAVRIEPMTALRLD